MVNFAELTEPQDFFPLRDDTSVVGLHHTRCYQIEARDSDGFCGVSTCSYDWAGVIADTRRYLANGSHHVRITGIESWGRGYFPAERKSRTIADVMS